MKSIRWRAIAKVRKRLLRKQKQKPLIVSYDIGNAMTKLPINNY